MKRQVFRVETDGFNGAWYPCAAESKRGIIAMLGDSAEDYMASCGAKWLNRQGIHVLAMSPEKKDYGHHNIPLERFGKAIAFLKAQGIDKLGVVGASTTGMMALLAASGDNESTVTWQGKPLPYLPYAYRHPEYWQQIVADSKAGGDKIASRKMFDESERRHPIQEEERIKVEKIRGKLIFIGAEDDVLWDTCKYIRRMEERLERLPHDSVYEAWLYEHGTHFAFPESLLKSMLPVGSGLLVSFMFKAGKEHPRECRETRLDIDRRLKKALAEW